MEEMSGDRPGPGRSRHRRLGGPLCLVLLSVLVSPAAGADPDRGSPGTGTGHRAVASVDDPPFSPNVRVNDATADRQNEPTLAADPSGNLYAGWNDRRFASYRCAYSRSVDGGKSWAAAELYTVAGFQCGDTVVDSDKDGDLYRLAMLYSGSNKRLDVSRSTDGGANWGGWSTVTSGSDSDKPWMVSAGGGIVYVTWSQLEDGSVKFSRSSDHGANWSAPVSLGAGFGPCMETDDAGTLYVAWGTYTIKFRRSTDGGATFSPEVKVGEGGATGSSPRSFTIPSCAASADGSAAFVTWSSNNASSPWDVWAARSPDRGATWGAPVKVSDDTTGGKQIMPAVGVDPFGRAHVMWTDFRNNAADVYYSNSTDGGATWAKNIRANDASGAIYTVFMGDYQDLAITPAGDVAYVWCDTRDNADGEIYFTSARLAGKGGGGSQIARIDVTPPSATITADQTLQLAAQAFDSNGTPVPTRFAWSASGGNISSTGLYTPDRTGAFTASATAGGVVGTASVTVTAGALAAIRVAPASATITADDTQQFTASGKDARGNPVVVTPAWSATGGSMSGSGLFTPDRVGSFRVTANQTGHTGNAIVGVSPGKPVKLDVSPATATMTVDETLALTAMVTDAKGNQFAAAATWQASGGAVSPTGVFSADSPGVYSVSATLSGLTATGEITVKVGRLARVEIAPIMATLKVGEKLKFTVYANDSKKNQIQPDSVKWEVTGGIGTVDQTGEFTATRVGTGMVKAEVHDGQASVTQGSTVSVKEGTSGGGGGGGTSPPDPRAAGALTWALTGGAIGAVVALALGGARMLRKRKGRDVTCPACGASNATGSLACGVCSNRLY